MFVNLTCINQHLSIMSTKVLTGVTVIVILVRELKVVLNTINPPLVRDQHVETFCIWEFNNNVKTIKLNTIANQNKINLKPKILKYMEQ